MNRKKNYTKNHILYSLIVNAITLLASLFIYRPFFEENDDAFISMIAEGAYGTREVHLIYANVVLGYVYRFLYSLCPFIRWHSVLQYVFMFMALTAFTYVIRAVCSEAGHENTGKVLPIVFILAVFHELYVSVQYSKTATFVSVIGYVLIVYVLYRRKIFKDVQKAANDKLNKKIGKAVKKEKATGVNLLMVIAYLLLIYGMLLRDSSYMLASLMTLPLLVCDFAGNMKRGKGRRGRVFLRYFLAFLPLLAVFAGSELVNHETYSRDVAWKDFMEYNDTRMELLDYRYDLLDYNKYADRLRGLKINENDALLYLTWQFSDDSVLSLDKMNAVLKGAPARWTVSECAKALARHIYEDVLIFDPIVFAAMIAIIYLIFYFIRKRDREGLLVLGTGLVVFAGILVYYEYCGRWCHRIVFAAMLALTVELLCLVITRGLSEKAGLETDYMVNSVLTLIAVTCIAVLLGNRLDYNSYRRDEQDYRTMLESLKNDKDTLYVADTFTFQRAYRYDVFKPYGQGSLDNFVTVGSWFVNSPITRGITDRYGYSNPFAALAGKDSVGKSVLLIDNMYKDEKLKYLNDHYDRASAYKAFDKYGFCGYLVEVGNSK